MRKLTEKKLELNIPISKEDIEFDSTLSRYLKVFNEMSAVFIKHQFTIDEGIEFLEYMILASHEFKLQGVETVEEMMNQEED